VSMAGLQAVADAPLADAAELGERLRQRVESAELGQAS